MLMFAVLDPNNYLVSFLFTFSELCSLIVIALELCRQLFHDSEIIGLITYMHRNVWIIILIKPTSTPCFKGWGRFPPVSLNPLLLDNIWKAPSRICFALPVRVRRKIVSLQTGHSKSQKIKNLENILYLGCYILKGCDVLI